MFAVSWDAIRWALEQKLDRLSDKFVLVILGNWADETGASWRPIKLLAEDACGDPKTIQASLARLQVLKLISDTGKREGHTKGIVVFQLALPVQKRSQKRDHFKPG